jgi:hypothetical protein
MSSPSFSSSYAAMHISNRCKKSALDSGEFFEIEAESRAENWLLNLLI